MHKRTKNFGTAFMCLLMIGITSLASGCAGLWINLPAATQTVQPSDMNTADARPTGDEPFGTAAPSSDAAQTLPPSSEEPEITSQPTVGATPPSSLQPASSPTSQPTADAAPSSTLQPTASPTPRPTLETTPSPTPKPAVTPTKSPVSKPESPVRYGRESLSARMKEQYDILLDGIRNFKEEITVNVPLSEIGGSASGIGSLITMLRDDYPEIFWIPMQYGYSYFSDRVTAVSLDYVYTKNDAQQKQKQIEAKANQILAGLSSSAGDYEKSKYIYEQLIFTVQYPETVPSYSAAAAYLWDITGVFLKGTAVCEGYSRAYQYLMNRAGLQCTVQQGEANGGAHMWNAARIEGSWVQTDVTWGDPIISGRDPKYISYQYLNITDAQMKADHTYTTEPYGHACTDGAKSYFVKEDLYFTSFQKQAVEAALREQLRAAVSGQRATVQLRFSTQALYDRAAEELDLWGIGQQVQKELGRQGLQFFTMSSRACIYTVYIKGL